MVQNPRRVWRSEARTWGNMRPREGQGESGYGVESLRVILRREYTTPKSNFASSSCLFVAGTIRRVSCCVGWIGGPGDMNEGVFVWFAGVFHCRWYTDSPAFSWRAFSGLTMSVKDCEGVQHHCSSTRQSRRLLVLSWSLRVCKFTCGCRGVVEISISD